MLLTRQAARFAKGWDRDAGRRRPARRRPSGWPTPSSRSPARSSTSTAPPAGRSCWPPPRPTTWSGPLADALGFDDVVATRYGVDATGRYDGTHRRRVRVGPGQAARRCATGPADHGVDARATAGPTPTASTTCRCCRRSATRGGQPRPPPAGAGRRCGAGRSLHLDVPAGRAQGAGAGIEPQRLVQTLARPELLPCVRFDIDGIEHIPDGGPAIVVANHRSYFDPLALGVTFARAGRPVRFLGKKEVFDAPVVGQLARAHGRHPGRPGHRVGRAAARRRPRRWPAASSWRSCPRARSPGAGRSSTPS